MFMVLDNDTLMVSKSEIKIASHTECISIMKCYKCAQKQLSWSPVSNKELNN